MAPKDSYNSNTKESASQVTITNVRMQKVEILQELPHVRHEVSQCCWKNHTSELAWHTVATNLQCVKRPVSNRATKWGAAKRGTAPRRSVVWLCATPWAAARQAPLSMGFSRQESCSGLPCPSPGVFPAQGSNLRLPESPALVVGSLPCAFKNEACLYYFAGLVINS